MTLDFSTPGIHGLACKKQIYVIYWAIFVKRYFMGWDWEYSQRMPINLAMYILLSIHVQCNKWWLTHWGQVTHICVNKLTTIGSDDNGLSTGRRQTNIWTNAGILLIRTLGIHFNELLSEIHVFHSRKYIRKCRLRNGGKFVSALIC